MKIEQIIDNLLWMACWLEQPPPVPDGRCYEIAEALRAAVDFIKKHADPENERRYEDDGK